MLSYILVTFTFAIGVTSALFDVKQKDENGKSIVGRFGLPKLTRPGIVSLSLLTISFIATFASAVVTENKQKDASKKADQLQGTVNQTETDLTKAIGQLTSTQTKLDTAQIKLEATHKAIDEMAHANANAFDRVSSDLNSTSHDVENRLEGSSRSLENAVNASMDTLDKAVRGRDLRVKGIMLTVFFLGGQFPEFSEGREGTVDQWTNCKTASPIGAIFGIPLAVAPRLDFDAEGDFPRCLSNMRIWSEQFGRAVQLQHVRLRPPCETTEVYTGSYVPEDPNPFDKLAALSAASFRPESKETISVSVGVHASADEGQIKKYLAPRLPLVIGFTLVPSTEVGWDFRFEERAAFALNLVELLPGSPGKSLEYRYTPTRFRPEWHAFDFENLYLGSSLLKEEPIQNKYADPDSAQAPRFHVEGDKKLLGACEAVIVK